MGSGNVSPPIVSWPVDVSTVSRQVTHLAQQGLLVKVPDAEDGRAHRVTLTPAGQAAIQAITDARSAWLTAILSDWTESEKRDFLGYLGRFTSSLEAAKVRHEQDRR